MYADNFLCLQINTDESSYYKVENSTQASGAFVSVEPHASACLSIAFFPSLLILYAEAAWLSTVKTALHKLQAPWGICVELNLKARLFCFCFFVLQMGGGSDKMLQSIRCSRVLLGSAAGSNRIHFSATPSSSSPITAPLRACNALIQRWSLLQ